MGDIGFHDLYRKIQKVRVADYSVQSLPDLAHGYISVYSMIRIYPELEKEYGTLGQVHERLQEIAQRLSIVVKDEAMKLDERIGYIVDLMDTYQAYSDMEFLNTALDMAYRILSPREEDKIVLPGKTPNVCRLLCNCYYFTGEEECVELAREIVEGWYGERDEERGWDDLSVSEIESRLNSIKIYMNIVNAASGEDVEKKIDEIEHSFHLGYQKNSDENQFERNSELFRRCSLIEMRRVCDV